jgi:hypothetical protein
MGPAEATLAGPDEPQTSKVREAMKLFPYFRDLERAHGITWRALVELEPKLAELLWEARQACITCRRWSDVDRAFAAIRHTLAELVGVSGSRSSPPVVGSVGAYEVAYWRLYEATARRLLPPDWGGREPTAVAKAPPSPEVARLKEATVAQ